MVAALRRGMKRIFFAIGMCLIACCMPAAQAGTAPYESNVLAAATRAHNEYPDCNATEIATKERGDLGPHFVKVTLCGHHLLYSCFVGLTDDGEVGGGRSSRIHGGTEYVCIRDSHARAPDGTRT